MAQIKGTAMIGLVRFLRKQREQALPLVPPELRHYLEERIFESRWYPEEHLIPLVRVCAELAGGDLEATLESFGRITARDHLEGGIYSHLAGAGDPQSFTIRAVALWSSQHDSGQMQVAVEGEGVASLRLDHYDHSSREMCLILTGYFQQFAESTKLPNPKLEKQRCVHRGDPHCEWELRWD
jgi:hypothetical protein